MIGKSSGVSIYRHSGGFQLFAKNNLAFITLLDLLSESN
jgi:hypothetical protein